MLVRHLRLSSGSDRQSTALQRDALIVTGVDGRHLFEGRPPSACNNRPGIKACLNFLKPSEMLEVWKLDCLGRSLPRLPDIGLRDVNAAFQSLMWGMDTNVRHEGASVSYLSAILLYKVALDREERQSKYYIARPYVRHGGRQMASKPKNLNTVLSALDPGASMAVVCTARGIAPSTLIDTLVRIGGASSGATRRSRMPVNFF